MPYREKDCRKLYVTEFFFFWKILVTWGRQTQRLSPRPSLRGHPRQSRFSCVRNPHPAPPRPAALRPAGSQGSEGPVGGGTLTPAGPTQAQRNTLTDESDSGGHQAQRLAQGQGLLKDWEPHVWTLGSGPWAEWLVSIGRGQGPGVPGKKAVAGMSSPLGCLFWGQELNVLLGSPSLPRPALQSWG